MSGAQALDATDCTTTNVALIATSSLFDSQWYYQQYPDVAEAGTDAARHYVVDGANEGRDPGPHFNTNKYLEANPDVQNIGTNPLVHYILNGVTEGRSLVDNRLPFSGVKESTIIDCLTPDVEILQNSDLFDAQWYYSQYPDVSIAGIDAAFHYSTNGAIEGRDPGPCFNTNEYLNANPDVQHNGMNPLVHYILYGAAEGRLLVDNYREWIAENERLTDRDYAAISQHLRDMKERPLISIVVPTYDTRETDLRSMVLSVKRQLYPNWELCIADDNSKLPHVRKILYEFSRYDGRIKVIERSFNGGIAAATNSAIGITAGDYLAFLDHDDLLHETALYEVVAEINKHPNADLIFSDSDEIDEHDKRSNPYFKLGWNYEVLLAQNVISHLGVYRTSTVKAVGGLREQFDGSQDYDLALRIVDSCLPGQVRHIPAILYHWRRSTDAISYSDIRLEACVESGRKAISEHLARAGINAAVKRNHLHPTWSRVIYEVPTDKRPSVGIIMLLSDDSEFVAEAVDRFLTNTHYANVLLFAVADEHISKDVEHDLDVIAKRNDVRVIRSRAPLTKVQACRLGIEMSADCDVVVLADAKLAVVSSSLWLEELVSQVIRPGVAAAGPKVHFRNGGLDDVGGGALWGRDKEIDSRSPGYFGLFRVAREVPILSWPGMALHRLSLIEAGGLDPTAMSLEVAVFDLCTRMRANRGRLLWTPFAAIERHHDAVEARNERAVDVGAQGLDARVRGILSGDEWYNPNLRLDKFGAPCFPSRREKPWAKFRNELDIREGQLQRARSLLQGVDRNASIVEIGASYSPIAPRADGWNTVIIDHAAREELVAKYDGEPDVWTDRIEEVDYIWKSDSIADAIPKSLHGTFDVLISSHMIEHTTDLLGFLRSAERLLAPSGFMILAIPDKRYCFDYFRPLTTSAEIIDAHRRLQSRHDWKTAFEHLAYSVLSDGRAAWGQEPIRALSFSNTFGDAMLKLDERTSSEGYADFHAWKFTPATFELMLLETSVLDLSDWQLVDEVETAGCEFQVRLCRGGAAAARRLSPQELDNRRMTLLRRSLIHVREQIDWTLGERELSTAPLAKQSDAGPKKAEPVPLPFGYRLADRQLYPRVAVVLHLFHTEISAEIRELLDNIPGAFDIFISTTDEDRANYVRVAFSGWSRGAVEVKVVPNRGRDIAPKIVSFRDIYADYDLVLFLHSKRSSHSIALEGWRNHLLSTLVGSRDVVENIFEMFHRRPSLGIVAPTNFDPISESIRWGPNLKDGQYLAERMGFDVDPEGNLDMPAGSMFWARPAALAPLLDLALDIDEFPSESAQFDGTLAHAIERLFFYVCEHVGFEWIKIEIAPVSACVEISSPAELDSFMARSIVPLRCRASESAVIAFDERRRKVVPILSSGGHGPISSRS